MPASERGNLHASAPAVQFTALPARFPWIGALAVAHAALFMLALPPFNLWPLAFIAGAPLAWLAMRASSTRQAIAVTLVTQWLMWMWLVHWIIPVTAVGFPLLALYLAIWPCVMLGIIRRISRQRTFRAWPMALCFPTVWTGVEFFRGDVLFYGYPWYLLAHPLIAVPALVQSADLFGTYFISFLAAIVSGSIVDVAAGLRPWSARQSRSRGRVVAIVGAAVVIVGLNIAYGVWRIGQAEPLSDGPRILAIQTNLPQDNKVGWSPEQQAIDVPQFIELTRRAFDQADPKPDLIVWPETMVPSLGFESQTIANLRLFGEKAEHLWQWTVALERLSRELHTPMLVGSESWIDTSIAADDSDPALRKLVRKHTYNSAYLIQGDPPYQRYDKYFLTPFGETMPYISGWPWLERQFLTLGVGADLSFNLDSNPEIRLLQLHGKDAAANSNIQRHVFLATPICFEDTVARYCRRMAYNQGIKRADAFVNISNDGWFGQSVADRELHAQIARFRCIENRVPMVRSVNTGVSVAIDSTGRIMASAGRLAYGAARQEGWVLADTKLDSRATLYGRCGEVWPWACLILTFAFVTFTIIKKREAIG